MDSASQKTKPLELTLAALLIRIWLSLRSIVTGLEKFGGTQPRDAAVLIDGEPNAYGLTETVSGKIYSLSNYQGVPETLYVKFEAEPLIPQFALSIYDSLLGPALLILGAALLLGVATRISLFAMGLLYTSLTFGLLLIQQDAGVAWLGTHIILIVLGLSLTKYDGLKLLKKW